MSKHDFEACASNICETDPEKHLRTWFPDEERDEVAAVPVNE